MIISVGYLLARCLLGGLMVLARAGRFRLAVVGQFSRGKITLMNALLGGAYLPMGLPMTSVITTVRSGSRPRALVRSRSSSFHVEVPVPEVPRFVAQQSAERPPAPRQR